MDQPRILTHTATYPLDSPAQRAWSAWSEVGEEATLGFDGAEPDLRVWLLGKHILRACGLK